ncbi:MAG: 30S ribosome-binding factor RbfA [Christensenellales bacterium]
MANFRNDRISEEMRKGIDRIIRDDVDDPRLKGTFSITRVEVTRDLRYAKVHVSVLEAELKEGALKALKSAAGFIRHELGLRINIRYTPELLFTADDNIAYGIHIAQLLKQVQADGTKAGEEHEGDL